MPTPTNILFISHSAGCHGAEKSLTTLLKHIDRSRFNPIVILPENGPLEHQLNSINIEYYIIPMPRWVNWEKKRIFEKTRVTLEENKAVQSLITITQKYNIKLVYSNTIANRTGAKLANKLNLPHIWHIREILPGNPNLKPVFSLTKTLDFTLNNANTLILISNAVKQQFPVKQISNIKIVYNYVDYQCSNKSPAPKSKGFKLIFAGTIIKRKGIDTAIKAVNILSKTINDITFDIIGTPSDYINELKQLCKDQSVTDRVNFIDHVDNIQDYLNASHIMLVPSHNEPWGRVVVEAMLTGLPVIGANAGGIPEIITDGKNGFLASPNDPQDWADKIEWIYNHYDQALNIAQFAQEHARKTYTIENYVGQIEKIIGDCLGK